MNEDDVDVHWTLRCSALVCKLTLSKRQSGSICTHSTVELIIAATPLLSLSISPLFSFYWDLSFCLCLRSPPHSALQHTWIILYACSRLPERVGLSARTLQSFHMFALSLNNYRTWVDVSFSHFDSFIMTQWEVNKLIPQMMNLERRREEKPTKDMSGHQLSHSFFSGDKYLMLRLKFMG